VSSFEELQVCRGAARNLCYGGGSLALFSDSRPPPVTVIRTIPACRPSLALVLSQFDCRDASRHDGTAWPGQAPALHTILGHYRDLPGLAAYCPSQLQLCFPHAYIPTSQFRLPREPGGRCCDQEAVTRIGPPGSRGHCRKPSGDSEHLHRHS